MIIDSRKWAVGEEGEGAGPGSVAALEMLPQLDCINVCVPSSPYVCLMGYRGGVGGGYFVTAVWPAGAGSTC